jgi:DNA-binding transcriptional LysR family regulator
MVRALQMAGVAYRVAVTSSDHQTCMIAVESGHALTVLPKTTVPASLVCARDYYLPALGTAKILLCATEALSSRPCPLLDDLRAQFFGAQAAELIAS